MVCFVSTQAISINQAYYQFKENGKDYIKKLHIQIPERFTMGQNKGVLVPEKAG